MSATQRRGSTRRRERLWREVLGERLRELRRDRGRTLTQTARQAGMSPQYLSEVERGLKEPSSEMIAAVADALNTSLVELTGQVADELRREAAFLTLLTTRRADAASRSQTGRVMLAA